MEEEKNTQIKSGESIRKVILGGVFVFTVAAVMAGTNNTQNEVVLYPIEVVETQSASVNYATRQTISNVENVKEKNVDIRRLPANITVTSLEDMDVLDRESCAPELNFGGHDTNCSIRGADCSVVLGNTVLTAQDQEDCWSFTPDAYFSCMENKCLMPTGIDIGLFTNVPSMNIEMHMGGVHPIVLDIEQKLQAKGFFTLTPDQTFGYKTLDAIKAFQTANKLPATGILDSQTINLLIK